MTVWFTSDTHYGHANVIKYSNRRFGTLQEMDEKMIANWNAVVKPGDLVYHLGDFSFADDARTVEIVKQLAGQKYLVYGNHDKRQRKNRDFTNQWQWTRDLTQIEVEGQKIVLCHFPMLTWNQSHHGSWQLHGHCHGTLPDDPTSRRIDVGVDCFDYTPVSFEAVKKLMEKKKFVPIDHHRTRGEGE